MATGSVISVTTSATKLTGDQDGSFLVQNVGAVNVFVGGSTVTASGDSKGKRLQPNEGISFFIRSGDDLYGIVASGTCDVDVLRVDA